MKSIGKIVAFLFLIFVLTGISLVVQEILGIRITRLTVVAAFITCYGAYFFTFSKWANDNIWNTKTSKPNNKSNTSSKEIDEPIADNKIPKEVNQNSNPNNNNTLLYVIIGLLVAILVVVLVRSPESQQSNLNKRETIQRETIPRETIPREEIERTKVLETAPSKPSGDIQYQYFYVKSSGNNGWSSLLVPYKQDDEILIAQRRSGESEIRTEYYLEGNMYTLETLELIANSKAEEEEGYNLYTLFKRNPNIKIVHRD